MRTSAPRSSHGGLGRMDPVASLKGLLDRNAGLLVAAASALLCLPFVNSIWLLADEGIWLHAAQRMLDAPSHAERRVGGHRQRDKPTSILSRSLFHRCSTLPRTQSPASNTRSKNKS